MLSHPTYDWFDDETIARLDAVNSSSAAAATFRPRSRDEIARFLTGLEPVEPGLVPVSEWRDKDDERSHPRAEQTAMYAAVARLP